MTRDKLVVFFFASRANHSVTPEQHVDANRPVDLTLNARVIGEDKIAPFGVRSFEPLLTLRRILPRLRRLRRHLMRSDGAQLMDA